MEGSIPEDKELKRKHVDLQKRFPIYQVSLMVFRFSVSPTSPSAPGGDHLSIPHPGHWHPAAEQQSPLRRDPSRFPQVPFQHSRSRVATLVQAGRTIYLALRRPDCTSSRLFALVAEEDDRPVTQSIATPEPGCPDPHPRSSRSLLRP